MPGTLLIIDELLLDFFAARVRIPACGDNFFRRWRLFTTNCRLPAYHKPTSSESG
jgi:hypothetical protein